MLSGQFHKYEDVFDACSRNRVSNELKKSAFEPLKYFLFWLLTANKRRQLDAGK